MNLFEGLNEGDLNRLVRPELHIDQFRSKMGDDDEIVVVSFLVTGKNPAMDLMGFLEKGFNDVLDADVSTGEFQDGKYLVFVEIKRRTWTPAKIIEILVDMEALTEIDHKDWEFMYYKNDRRLPVTQENLENEIPNSPREYREYYGDKDMNGIEDGVDVAMESLQMAAGMNVNRYAPRNKFTDKLREQAGVSFNDHKESTKPATRARR